MALNFSVPTAPQTAPTKAPDPKQIRKQIKDFKKQQKEVGDIKTEIEKSINDINKKMTDTFEKTAKLICLLRLDMLADKLENINRKWASQVDTIANDIEKLDWED